MRKSEMTRKSAVVTCVLLLGAGLSVHAQSADPVSTAVTSATRLAESLAAGSGAEVEAPAAPVPTASGRPVARAGASALIAKFQITRADQLTDPQLRELKAFVEKNLSDGDEEAYLVSDALKIGSAGSGFYAADLLALLNGRISDQGKIPGIDLALSDGEAATREDEHNFGLVVDGARGLYCSEKDPGTTEKNAKKAAAEFLPYKSGRAAKQAGQDWTTEQLEQAGRMVEGIAFNCRFEAELIDMTDTGDNKLHLLAVIDRGNSEVLVIGFGSYP